MTRWDIILIGGGLANGLIAMRLRQCQPKLRILLLEAGSRPGGNHTWSFHQQDLSVHQLQWTAPLISYRWPGYDVEFPHFSRSLSGEYLSVTSERFAAVIGRLLGANLLTDQAVKRIDGSSVQLADGHTLHARAVIDGRGWQPGPYLRVGCQAFVGQQWHLAQPHGLTRPILMDATVDQLQGYRFVYTLPLSPTCLLIEDTHYIDNAEFDSDRARQHIRAYAAARGWQLERLQREEQGRLPIILTGQHRAFWQQLQGQPCSGLRAGLFHPTTGYSLPLAVSLADAIAAAPLVDNDQLYALIRTFAARQWRRQRFFRLLNRMLFLAGEPTERRQVMARFYRLDAGLIARFYAGRLTFNDMAHIVSGKPPVPLVAALGALLKITPRLRAFDE